MSHYDDLPHIRQLIWSQSHILLLILGQSHIMQKPFATSLQLSKYSSVLQSEYIWKSFELTSTSIQGSKNI